LTASGGSGGYQYQFSRLGPDTGGSSVVVKAYSTSNTWAWATTGAMAGSNTITVTVKDSSGATGTNSVVYTLSATSTTGNSYYISPTGSDSNTGSITSPWKTISSSSAKLKPGDTLYARGGTYTGQGNIIWKNSGTSTAPITFKAYPGETPLFDGGWNLGQWLEFINNVGYVTVDGFTAQHFADSYGNGCIYTANGANNIIIQNCQIVYNGTHTSQDHGVYVGGGTGSNITIRNNIFDHNASSAIQSYHSPNVTGLYIYNNIITNHPIGVIIGDGSNTEVYNNTIDKCSKGIDIYYAEAGPSNITIKNNIISNCTSYGMRVASSFTSQVHSDYNDLYNNAITVQWGGSNYSLSQFQSATGNDTHSTNANPSYVNASTGNYRLNSTSPAANKGTALGKVPNDKDYVARPRGAAYDIGAYESY
jgi:hypothetical protein